MKFTASGGFGSDTAQAQNAIGGGGVPSPSRGSSKVDPTLCFGALAALLAGGSLRAFDRPEITSKIFQFPQDKIPRIDGEISDWALVPDTYAIKTDQFADDGKPNRVRDPQNLDVKIRVGRVKGLNRLYVLYEAADNYWDFGRPDLPNDALELMVDGDASELCAFQLMPLEPALLPALEARWSFKVVDIDRRLGAFKDESIGTAKIASWKWDFGDGETSTEQHPIHTYKKAGNTVVILDVTDTAGQTPRRSKVWDVQLR